MLRSPLSHAPRLAPRPLASARRWLFSHISIRLRLALWQAALLFVILTLFSSIGYAVTQANLYNNVDQNLKGNATLIADAIQSELVSDAASASATPATAPATLPTTISASPTPSPTPNPKTQQDIQTQLNLRVPGILDQMDLAFEVFNSKGTVTYRAQNLSGVDLPLDAGAVDAALVQGVPHSYTMSRYTSHQATLLRLYVQPITFRQQPAASPTTESGATPKATSKATASSTTSAPLTQHVVGAVLVAQPINDITDALASLRQILFAGALIATFFALLGTWFLAGSGLQPISGLTRTARAIAMNAHAAGLGRRVGYSGPRDEVGELAATFDDMLAAIERVATAQRRFVADASHELRAPLTSIKGNVEFLRRATELPQPERSAVLEDIYAETERLTTLINDLLLLARADAAASSKPGSNEARLDDQLRGRREVVELDQLVLDAFRHARTQLETRRTHHLRLSISNLEPVAVLADPGQLKQVTLILLDNAIKYTPEQGRVSIGVAVEGQRAGVIISDSGIGIEREALPHIFERFYRGDSARTRDEFGSGLGLAIAQWIVEAHGGEIRVQSEPGQGSVFSVLLPALRRTEDGTSAKLPVRPRHGSRPTLVAEAIRPLTRLAGRVGRPSRPSGDRPRRKTEPRKTTPRPATEAAGAGAHETPPARASESGASSEASATPSADGRRQPKRHGTTKRDRSAPPAASKPSSAAGSASPGEEISPTR